MRADVAMQESGVGYAMQDVHAYVAAKPGEVAQVIQAGYRNGTVASYPASRWCRSARMTTASTASSQSYKAT